MTQGLDALWGGILDAVSLDIVHQTITFVVRVPHAEHESTHRLEVRGTRELRFFNAIPGPWIYAELTEIHAELLPTRGLLIRMMIWSEGASIVVEADAATLDDAELAVRGQGC